METEETQAEQGVDLDRPGAGAKERSGYIPTLDGWRAVAILWVMQAHSALLTVGRFNNDWVRTYGSRGVQLFFALSGFLICTRLLREEERYGGISLRSFYTRRLFRIQPAALTYLLIIVLLGVGRVIPLYWPGIAGAVLMVRNIWPHKLGPGAWYSNHYWSLSVEEHFYLLLPGFLVLVKRHRLLILAVAAVALELWLIKVMDVLATAVVDQWQLAQRTDLVMGGILLGSVFALALRREDVVRWATLLLRPWVAVVYAAFIFAENQRHHSTSVQTLLITVYPVVIVATALHPKSWLGRALEWAPVRFVGRISYSLYLWQQLFFNTDEAPVAGSLRSHTLLCWCATFACAIASYYMVETPLVRRGHRIAKKYDLQEKEASKEKHAIAS
jgi:peptidoglycan/LPS O-acetylase OafA/YrhL